MAVELRVFVEDRCIVTPEAAPELLPALLGLIVPKLIETAIGGVAGWLKKAGEKDVKTATGSKFENLYVANPDQALTVNPKLACVIAVWGDFEAAGKKPTPADDEAVLALEAAKLIPKDSEVRVVFEAAIRREADDTAFHLETRHFSVREFVGKRGEDERDFVATLNVTTPDATAGGQTIALGTIELGRVKKNTFRQIEAPRRSNLMPWNQVSKASKAAYDADVAAGRAQGKEYMPVTFGLSLSETADGNAFLTALGNFLDGAKGDAAKEITKKILPEQPSEAEQTEAAEKLYENELAAELEVRKKQKEYDEADASSKPVKRMELEIAKRKLERQKKLRIAAGLPSLDPIPED